VHGGRTAQQSGRRKGLLCLYGGRWHRQQVGIDCIQAAATFPHWLIGTSRLLSTCRVQSTGPHTVTGGRCGLLLLCLCVCWLQWCARSCNQWAVVLAHGHNQLTTSGGNCIAHSARRTPWSVRYAHCLCNSYLNSPGSSIPVFYGNWLLPFPGIREWKKAGNPGRPGITTLSVTVHNFVHRASNLLDCAVAAHQVYTTGSVVGSTRSSCLHSPNLLP